MSNKLVIAIVILLSIAGFAWLTIFGWINRYGPPSTYQVDEPNLFVVSYRPDELSLKPEDVFAPIWQNVPSIEVALYPQITEKPWPMGHTNTVKVQGFHNGKDIYFKMVWQDDQEDAVVSGDKFTDGCAVAVPIDADAPVRSIMMGFSSTVNIWHWQAATDVEFWQGKTQSEISYADYIDPFEDKEVLSVITPKLTSAVVDLLAERVGSLTRKDRQRVQGRGLWRNGSWNVVLKRSLTTEDSQRDCQFAPGRRSVSFAVWDGDEKDRGGRKSISEWVNLQIEPQPATSAIRRFSLLSAAYGATAPEQPTQAEPRVINIKAQRFFYTPNQITVQKGELITIRMESLDVSHGLYIDGYGVDIKARPGVIGKATFVADKPGRFSFRCSETCGEFHPYMIGFLDVTPNSRFSLFVIAIGITFVIVLGIVLSKARQEKGVEGNAGTE